jgi:hypothetical protein
MRRSAAFMAVWLAVAGCGPIVTASPPTPAPPTASPPAYLATIIPRTLPPQYTPTPSPTFLPTLAATPDGVSDSPDVQRQAMRSEFQEVLAADPGWTRYDIRAEVIVDGRAEQAQIRGVARIRFTNPGSSLLQDLVLMLWPNDDQYRSTMRAGPALIDGQLVVPQVELEGLALRFKLPAALNQGDNVDLSVPFEIQASGGIGGRAPARFGISQGVLFAPTFYPLVPRLIDGKWEEKRAPSGGDTTNSNIALYSVQLTGPSDLNLAASGVEVDRQDHADGTTTVAYVTGPVRDFAFACGPLVQDSVQMDGVTINGWVLEAHKGDMRRMLRLAAGQLDLMTQDVGPYPYTELDVVDLPGAFGGIEYPGLVTIGTVGTSDLEIPVIHEVAHQWFYGLIGDDQLEQPWLDEAAATYASVLYLEHDEGTGRATGELSHYRSVLANSPFSELPIGMGVGDYPNESAYSLIVYWKGALFFDALRQRMGDRAFFAFLKAYFQTYEFGFATSRDFQISAESACGCQLQSLFNLWVYDGGPLPVP